MQSYIAFKEEHNKDYHQINKQYNLIGTVRLLVALSFIYCLYRLIQSGNPVLLIILLALIAAFLILLNIHQSVSWKKQIKQSLIQINEDEIAYLQSEAMPFDNGAVYEDHTHAYSYDLDLFGPHSFYHHINRAATYIGQHKLATALLTLLPNDKIIENQKAIRELSQKIRWRQKIYAIARLTQDDKKNYENLITWSKTNNQPLSSFITTLSYVSPAIVITTFSIFLMTQNTTWGYVSLAFFVLNLILLRSQLKTIQLENFASGKINQIIKRYGFLAEKIEQEDFSSKKLNHLQEELKHNDTQASKIINRLSVIFSNLDNLGNVIGAVFSNGIYLSHVHTLRSLLKWKAAYADQLRKWLDIIGETESLNSFANLAYNNPDFTYPELNTTHSVTCKELGHPLIDSTNRVNNDISFVGPNFFILTGSNMSGKSTFLRTLGINMVLTGTGAPICATDANIHPLPVLVSMRLSDSLQDNESYFFAEVKRLKEIMEVADDQICFILLDEILRGTNSDDKRSGTIQVIKKIIAQNAIGVIATHDLEVCHTSEAYPDILANKCFEVDIINNDLSFDYKLRDGICKNKSATFLMKKMKII